MALFKDLKKEDVKETKTETISYVIFGQEKVPKVIRKAVCIGF